MVAERRVHSWWELPTRQFLLKQIEVWKIFIQSFLSLSSKSDNVWDVRYAAYPRNSWLCIVMKQLTPVQRFTKCVFSLNFEIVGGGGGGRGGYKEHFNYYLSLLFHFKIKKRCFDQ
jgi:hypothetical protein